jgi:small-conductance mechanosensitive channel
MFLFLLQDESAGGAFELNSIWSSMSGLVNSFLSRLPYIVVALIVFGVFIIIARIISRIINTAGERTRLDRTLAELLGRLASFVIMILGVFVAAVIIFPAFKPGDLVAGLGITSVAIGFAFKDVLQNFFAGILILWRKPFVVGDQLKFREYEGTVEEINVRSTRLITFDGERAVIPNGDIYANSVLVKTAYDKRRVRFVVGIGYLDDIEKGREVIGQVLNDTKGILPDPGPWIYVSELAPSSVNFTVYFWVESAQANVLKVSDKVATGIKYALDAAGIDMPYPHSVVLFHDTTGTRDGDAERAKLPPPLGSESRSRSESAK